ncbi:MAG: hypothetical protein IAF08_16870, partial [Rhizobacter sp.]|nr:hypothetical protein [Chlorobiales bacterium]
MNHRLLYLILTFLWVSALPTAATGQPITVCFYFKKVNPSSLAQGLVLQPITSQGGQRPVEVRMATKSQGVYVYFDRPAGQSISIEIVERDLAEKIGAVFSGYDRAKLQSPAHYKALIDLIAGEGGGDVLLRQIDLRAFGIADTVLAFNFGAVDASASLLAEANRSSKEAAALYNFTFNQWRAAEAQGDYRDRVRAADFKPFADDATLAKLFETPKPAALSLAFSERDKQLIAESESRATWAMILTGLSLVATIYFAFLALTSLRKRGEQFSKLESKVKQMESKLNRPFYQAEQSRFEEMERLAKTVELHTSRLFQIERKAGVASGGGAANVLSETPFQTPLAVQLSAIVQKHRNHFKSESSSLAAPDAEKLEMAQGDFTAELGLLDDGTPPQLFVQKHLIPHIDHIDHLFQPEPDATLQTPSVVSAYLRDLIE